MSANAVATPLEEMPFHLQRAGRIGDIVVELGFCSRDAVEEVVPLARAARRQLGEMLVERGVITPDQLADIYVTGADNKLVPLSTFATLKTTTEPRELKRFQQLNAVRIQGVVPPPVALDSALRMLEDEARRIARGIAITAPLPRVFYCRNELDRR